MCNPAFMVATTVLSTYVATKTASDQASYTSGVAKTNAINAEYQAADATRRGELAAIKTQQQTAQIQGAQRAGYAAKGLDLTEGTPGDVIDQTSFFGQQDAATARYNGQVESWAKRSQAAGFGASADAAQYNGQMGSAGSLLTGAGSVASTWYRYNNPKGLDLTAKDQSPNGD